MREHVPYSWEAMQSEGCDPLTAHGAPEDPAWMSVTQASRDDQWVGTGTMNGVRNLE